MTTETREIMRITRIDNHYHSVNAPAIIAGDAEWWFTNGRLHRGGGKPAITHGQTVMYYYRGVRISREIARGELPPGEILKISNMEQRQVAMEILGYERFFNIAKEIHRATPEQFLNKFPVNKNPMYTLYLLDTKVNEQNDPIKILMMSDPSKFPLIKYFIRVHPDETNCLEAVAHSYQYKSWKEFNVDREWV